MGAGGAGGDAGFAGRFTVGLAAATSLGGTFATGLGAGAGVARTGFLAIG